MTTNDEVLKFFRGIKQDLRDIDAKLNLLFQGDSIIMTQLTDALDEIEKNAEADRSADSAAKALIVKLGKMITDGASGAPTPEAFLRLKAIGQGMVDRAADLSAAVVAGTPAETPPADPPVGGQSTGGSTPID